MRDGVRYSTIGAGLGMAIGSFLPWGRVGVFSVAGTDGDGIFTLVIGGIVVAIGLINKPTIPAALAVGLLSIVAGFIVLTVFNRLDAETVGGGLMLTGGAAFVGLFTGFEIRNDAKRDAPPTDTPVRPAPHLAFEEVPEDDPPKDANWRTWLLLVIAAIVAAVVAANL